MGEAAADHKSGTFLVRKDARVAQLVEQRTENPRVGGSSPPPGTTFSCTSLICKLIVLTGQVSYRMTYNQSSYIRVRFGMLSLC